MGRPDDIQRIGLMKYDGTAKFGLEVDWIGSIPPTSLRSTGWNGHRQAESLGQDKQPRGA